MSINLSCILTSSHKPKNNFWLITAVNAGALTVFICTHFCGRKSHLKFLHFFSFDKILSFSQNNEILSIKCSLLSLFGIRTNWIKPLQQKIVFSNFVWFFFLKKKVYVDTLLTIHPPHVDRHRHLADHPPTPSCLRSYWMPPYPIYKYIT